MANDLTKDRILTERERPEVSVLASTVLSFLSDKGDEGAQTIRTSVVEKLVEAVLKPGTFDPEALLDSLRDRRINSEQVVDIYIPQAAHDLGQMWIDDTISFASVTIASARLQGLLTFLVPPWSAALSDIDYGPNVLLVLQGNDSHTLGPHVATAQLRRTGASVRILFGARDETVLRAVSEDDYDMVLFSGSRPDALASIAKLVIRIRKGISTPPSLVLGGIVLELEDHVKEKTDVDLVTNDVKIALKLCEKGKSKGRSSAT